MMSRNSCLLVLSCALFVISVTLLANSDALADAADSKAVAHLEAGHQKVDGVITDLKSGLYTIKTSTGTTYTLATSLVVRYVGDALKIGDELILWVNEGNMVMDVSRKGALHLPPHFMSGRLVAINYGQKRMTLAMAGGEKSFTLGPGRMFREMAVGTPVTIELNTVGEVIDLHAESPSNVPRRGFGHSQNDSAVQGFRHLGKPE